MTAKTKAPSKAKVEKVTPSPVPQPAQNPSLSDLASKPDDYGALYFALRNLVRPLVSLADASENLKADAERERLGDLLAALLHAVPQITAAQDWPLAPAVARPTSDVWQDLAAAATCIHCFLNTPEALGEIQLPMQLATTDLVRRAWKRIDEEHAEDWAKVGQEWGDKIESRRVQHAQDQTGPAPASEPAEVPAYLRPRTVQQRLYDAAREYVPVITLIMAGSDYPYLSGDEARLIVARCRALENDLDNILRDEMKAGRRIEDNEGTNDARTIAATLTELAEFAANSPDMSNHITDAMRILVKRIAEIAAGDDWTDLVHA